MATQRIDKRAIIKGIYEWQAREKNRLYSLGDKVGKRMRRDPRVRAASRNLEHARKNLQWMETKVKAEVTRAEAAKLKPPLRFATRQQLDQHVSQLTMLTNLAVSTQDVKRLAVKLKKLVG